MRRALVLALVVLATAARAQSGPPTIDVTAPPFGARADARTLEDGTFTAGSAVLTSATARFSPADCAAPRPGCLGATDKSIQVDGWNGPGRPPFVGRILGVSDPRTARLSAPASASGPRFSLGYATQSSPGDGTLRPGQVITLLGGDAIQPARLRISATRVRGLALAAPGTGGIDGPCVLRGTSGAAPFRAQGRIAGGRIVAIEPQPSITKGAYLANPPAAEPIDGCGLIGARVALTMDIAALTLAAAGDYAAVPPNPARTDAGASLTVLWNRTGTFTFGTDDSPAFAMALRTAMDAWRAGRAATVRIPAGTYFLSETALPLLDRAPIGIHGDGAGQTRLLLGAAYPGPFLFGWSEVWAALAASSPTAPTSVAGSATYGPAISGLAIFGNRLAARPVDAITFLDRTDRVQLRDIEVNTLRGRCLAIGLPSRSLPSSMRESVLSGLRCFDSGDAGLPAVEISATGQGDSTNEIDMSDISIYGASGPGLVIHGTAPHAVTDVRIKGLRIEGTEQNFRGAHGDLLQIGDPVLRGGVDGVSITQMSLIDPYDGWAALRIVAPAGTDGPYLNRIEGIIGGGVPLGKGLVIAAGRHNTLQLHDIHTWDINVTIGPGAGAANRIEPATGLAEGWTFDTPPGRPAPLYEPVLRAAPGGPLVFAGPPPRLSANCGAGATIMGNEVTGRVTIGTGGTGACTLTFATQYPQPPVCLLTSETTPRALAPATTTSTLAIIGSVPRDRIGYVCTGFR